METDAFHRLLHTAFDDYLQRMRADDLEPREPFLSFDFDFLQSRRWQFLGGTMVEDELSELTNILNGWHQLLRRWHAWNLVVTQRGTTEEETWSLRIEFVEPIAHWCLLNPSAVRDTLTFVVTNGMHQARLASEVGYADRLDGDPAPPSEQQQLLSRRQKERRLTCITAPWPESSVLLERLGMIDDDSYRRATSNYRNLRSHAIGPRLGIGETRRVVRSVTQATQMVLQQNGSYLDMPVPNKMSVWYSFGGTSPLDMEAARQACLQQFLRAGAAYRAYRDLLEVAMRSMPLASQHQAEPPRSPPAS